MSGRIRLEALSPSDRIALDRLLDQLRGLYSDRLKRVILFGHKSRAPQGSDLDLLVVIEGLRDRFVEMGRIHRLTGPMKVEEDILITAIPVDEADLETHRETSFFAAIIQDGIAL